MGRALDLDNGVGCRYRFSDAILIGYKGIGR
jgi:hypothetical protein